MRRKSQFNVKTINPLTIVRDVLLTAGFVFVALVFLLFDMGGSSWTASVTGHVQQVVSPIRQVITAPAEWARATFDDVAAWVSAIEENRHLKHENARLQAWYTTGQKLHAENQHLQERLKVLPPAGLSYQTARVIGHDSSPFSKGFYLHTDTILDSKATYIAMIGQAVVGRVIQQSGQQAQVIPLTDERARIPVKLLESGGRAVAAGQGARVLGMLYYKGEHAPKAGELVVTAGDGELFPPDLPVGRITVDAKGNALVKPLLDSPKLDVVHLVMRR